jgi:hypothetical protein
VSAALVFSVCGFWAFMFQPVGRAPLPGGKAAGVPVGLPVMKVRADKNVRLPLGSTGWTTVKGRVTLKGEKPDLAAMNKDVKAAIDAFRDREDCLAAPDDQKDQQTWRIGKKDGVANVFVWLAPPEGKYFEIDWDKKPWAKEVAINQPHCAYIPHAAVLFPGAYDPDNPRELKSSGQKFFVRNSAGFVHNTNWKGGDANPGDNKSIAPGAQIAPELRPDTDPIYLKCNVHGWMRGVVRVFDHPYATVTDMDGNYEIKGAPAGAELNIVVWHEAAGFGDKGKAGDKVTLEARKDNVHDYTISAPK